MQKIKGRYQPIHHRLATHWARLIELLYAAERMLELATDLKLLPGRKDDTGKNKGIGIGSVEAPEGLLHIIMNRIRRYS